MKIIFLDIDGVINTMQIGADLVPYYGTEDTCPNNIQAIRWLNKLCIETNAKIVISSSWRHAGMDKCRKAIYKGGVAEDIEIIDSTPTTWGDRGDEIKLWLDTHPEVEEFVILDDDTDMGDLLPYLVKCDHQKGFAAEEYTKAFRLLSGEKDR